MFDTSALLSLETIGLLKKAYENIDMVTTGLIIEELKEIREYQDDLGEVAREVLKAVKRGGIKVFDLSRGEVDRLDSFSSSIDKGEASCFILAEEKGIKFLILDDIKAASALESRAIKEGIDQRISVAIIVELLNKGVISKVEARETVDELIEDRGWKGGVLEVLAKKYLPEE